MARAPSKKRQPGDRMGPRPPLPVDSGAVGAGTEVVDEITFQDPPQKVVYDWAAISVQLRERPMEWALIFTQDRLSVVNAIRIGGIAAVHPDLGFETRTTHNVREPVRICDLYLRWNPDKVKPLAEALRVAREGEA